MRSLAKGGLNQRDENWKEQKINSTYYEFVHITFVILWQGSIHRHHDAIDSDGYQNATLEQLESYKNSVNIQDVLQVFQGSGIGKMEDNLTSADPPSFTTN